MKEEVAEEIEMMLGLRAKVVKHEIIIDTIAGEIKMTCSEPTLMGNVYRFINHYGLKMSKFGLDNKIKEFNKTNSKTTL